MSDRSVAQIEADIAQTREEIAATVAALGDKLHPARSARRHWPVLAVTGATALLVTSVVLWRRQH